MSVIFREPTVDKYIVLTLRAESDGDGGFIYTLYYDDVAVVYLSDSTGGIIPLKIETSPKWGDADVRYLVERGVSLIKELHPRGGKDDYEWSIILGDDA